MRSKLPVLFVIILILAMISFRAINPGLNPVTHNSLVTDEARVNVIAKNIAEEGQYKYSEGFTEDELSLGGSSIFWTGPLTIYSLAGAFFLFGAIYTVERLFIGLLSLLMVFVTYKIGKRLYNKNAGIVAALIIGLHPLIVFTSRIALHDILSYLFILIGAYFILHKEDANVFSGISYAIATMAKYSAGLLYPITFIYCIIRRDLKSLAMLTTGFLFLVLFMFLFFTANPGFVEPFFLSLDRNASHAGFGSFNYGSPLTLLNTIVFYFPFIGLFFIIKLIKREWKKKELFLWVWAVLGFLWWTTSLGTGKYALIFMVPLMILVAPTAAKRKWLLVPMFAFYLILSGITVLDFTDNSVYAISGKINTLDERAYFSEPEISFVSGKSMIPMFWLGGEDWRFNTTGFEEYYSQPINETASEFLNRTQPKYIVLSDISINQGHSPRKEMREAVIFHGQLLERHGPYRLYMLDWSTTNDPLYDIDKDKVPPINIVSEIKRLIGSR